jgi:hypothetical protein
MRKENAIWGINDVFFTLAGTGKIRLSGGLSTLSRAGQYK